MELNMHFTFEKNDSYQAVGKDQYGNFDIILDHFSRISQLSPTPHAL